MSLAAGWCSHSSVAARIAVAPPCISALPLPVFHVTGRKAETGKLAQSAPGTRRHSSSIMTSATAQPAVTSRWEVSGLNLCPCLLSHLLRDRQALRRTRWYLAVECRETFSVSACHSEVGDGHQPKHGNLDASGLALYFPIGGSEPSVHNTCMADPCIH